MDQHWAAALSTPGRKASKLMSPTAKSEPRAGHPRPAARTSSKGGTSNMVMPFQDGKEEDRDPTQSPRASSVPPSSKTTDGVFAGTFRHVRRLSSKALSGSRTASKSAAAEYQVRRDRLQSSESAPSFYGTGMSAAGAAVMRSTLPSSFSIGDAETPAGCSVASSSMPPSPNRGGLMASTAPGRVDADDSAAAKLTARRSPTSNGDADTRRSSKSSWTSKGSACSQQQRCRESQTLNFMLQCQMPS